MAKSEGLILLTDVKGYIDEIIYNGCIDIEIDKGEFFPGIIDEANIQKFLNFQLDLQQNDKVFNREINLKINQNIKTMLFSGTLIDKHFLIIAIDMHEDIFDNYQELMEINNNYVNHIRKLFKEQSKLKNKMKEEKEINDEEYIQSLSRLNNELTNLQRKLNKTNKELDDQREKFYLLYLNLKIMLAKK